MLDEAYKGGYAVGSYNVYNYETMRGVIEASQELRFPVIVAFGHKYLENMSLECAFAIASSLEKDAGIPVCLHLDHCKDIDTIYRAVRAGFTSVMYDGSELTFEENVRNTMLVCEVAHACGVSVEAELGSIKAGDYSHEGGEDDKEIFTDPLKALEFVERTGVDALAVSIGTVHGVYKGKPEIRTDILRRINEKLCIPLVLHGGSGTPEDKLLECISNGICKININTEISMHTVECTGKYLAGHSPHLSVLALKQVGYIKEVVKKYAELFMNKGG
ncbi:hypothetical protein AAG570_014166 [Ranatra chinensis]|uniref:Fructose-bisphosphate aldolase n=1 Tax=Ranatra chinensis TaxID=642074 RepID=A0ABD0XUV2_9HEMI